jgi:hypothetical protein
VCVKCVWGGFACGVVCVCNVCVWFGVCLRFVLWCVGVVSVRVPLCFNWSLTRHPVCTDFGGTVTVLYTLKCCAPQDLILATKCSGFLIFMDTLHSNSAYEQWGRMSVGTGQP